MIILKNYIGGKHTDPESGNYIDNVNPANGEVYSRVPDSSKEDLDNAVLAAKNAFPKWSNATIAYRSKTLTNLADLIKENLEQLCTAESMDTGKPVKLARTVDIPRAAANLKFFASAIVNDSSEAHIMEGEAVNYTRRTPLGIVGCISPWNLPLYLLTWKIAPALATGNCVIAKPSEITPYTAFLLSKLAIQAGVPEGVLNILHGKGPGIGQMIVDQPDIKAISFTGGTETGKIIGMAAAKQFKKASLELGGKNPVLIFDDCDFEEAVTTSVRGAFTNQGEICLCGSRIFIQETIYEKFKQEFTNQVRKLKTGNPKEDVDLGAIVSKSHLDKISGFVTGAKIDGANVLTGGNRLKIHDGFFYEPTVLEGLDEYCTINQQEVFGPVVTIMPFLDENDAITKANATKYGLASVIWTQDLKRAHRVAHKMESGIIWVNCWMLRDLRTPFGGMKGSGIGREGGQEALRFFTDAQNICIKL